MGYYPERDSHIKYKVKVVWHFAMKAEVDKLDFAKLVNSWTSLNSKPLNYKPGNYKPLLYN